MEIILCIIVKSKWWKSCPVNPVCRLCSGSHGSRYMLGIFSKAGLSKELYLKVYKICGNAIKFLRTIRSQQCYVGVALHS